MKHLTKFLNYEIVSFEKIDLKYSKQPKKLLVYKIQKLEIFQKVIAPAFGFSQIF